MEKEAIGRQYVEVNAFGEGTLFEYRWLGGSLNNLEP